MNFFKKLIEKLLSYLMAFFKISSIFILSDIGHRILSAKQKYTS